MLQILRQTQMLRPMPAVILDVNYPPVDLLDMVQIKDIPGLPGYRASTEGGIWSNKSNRWLSGWVDKNGYRLVDIHGRKYMVHVLILITFVSPKPDGMETRHLDNNPGHNALFNIRWGTQAENEEDKVRNGTHESCKTECPQGHKYTPENTAVYKKPNGHPRRMCKTCSRERSLARAARMREDRDRHTGS